MEHSRVILHLDIDYFYAQVEELLDPSLKNQPFGIKQGLNIVTCNYLARDYGVGKWKSVKECLEKCPNLKIVPGEDLTNYKQYSRRLSELLHDIFKRSTERVGLDEHYIDITDLVEEQLRNNNHETLHFIGPIMPDEESFDCNCGCKERLKIGSKIANDTRKDIYERLGLTVSVGIAVNKLQAKIVGQVHKPNNQTVLAPLAAKKFMSELGSLRNITGIGEKTESKLQSLGIETIQQLQECDVISLEKEVGKEAAKRLKDMSFGIDNAPVKPTGKPKSIGLENSFKPIFGGSLRSDAAEKFQALLNRLMIQIQDDGRTPEKLIRVTLRKYDSQKKTSIRETKQCALPTNCFKKVNGKIYLADGAEQKIMNNILRLFDRMIDLNQKFSITLIGLCFCKFQKEQRKGPGSIANYLLKKQDVEVHSITNLSNEAVNIENSFRSKAASPCPSLMDFETISNTSLDMSEEPTDDDEPTPKKRKKMGLLLFAKNRHSSAEDVASPSKLNVSNLNLDNNSNEADERYQSTSTPSTSFLETPPNIDPSVWEEIPSPIQQELILNWQKSSTNIPSSSISSPATVWNSKTKGNGSKATNNTLHRYFIRNS